MPTIFMVGDGGAPMDTSGYVEKAAAVKDQNSVAAKKIWSGTKAQYNAIEVKDSAVIYLVLEDPL